MEMQPLGQFQFCGRAVKAAESPRGAGAQKAPEIARRRPAAGEIGGKKEDIAVPEDYDILRLTFLPGSGQEPS
jgi:hypothetical protein